ncbi:MAG: ribosome-associated translation inhibitor RaiA [Clostridiales bacterium]|nr:ribosome-associated translation inhibitor RaiA [Clostridiales bacterium]
MNVKLFAKKMSIPEDFSRVADTKLKKLDRFFGDNADVIVKLTPQKDVVTLEISVKHDSMIFRAEQTSEDKYDALDAAVDKIIRQIRKNKTRLEKRLKSSAFDLNAAETNNIKEEAFNVIRRKKFFLAPMDVEEAILQMNLLGHQFFMFRDAHTDEINVVYKRADGNYAVIEPE